MLSNPCVNRNKYIADYEDRYFKQSIITRISALIDCITNSKILRDFDNYQATLTDYDYAKYNFSCNAQGYSQKVAELSQFFSGGGSDTAVTTPTTVPSASTMQLNKLP